MTRNNKFNFLFNKALVFQCKKTVKKIYIIIIKKSPVAVLFNIILIKCQVLSKYIVTEDEENCSPK